MASALGSHKRFKCFQWSVDSGFTRLAQHCVINWKPALWCVQKPQNEEAWKSLLYGLYSSYGYHLGYCHLLGYLHINMLTTQSAGLAAFKSIFKKVSPFIPLSTNPSPFPSACQEKAEIINISFSKPYLFSNHLLFFFLINRIKSSFLKALVNALWRQVG